MLPATVLIPTHEHCDSLAFSIASVLDQTNQDFELFVVGDGAPHATKALLEGIVEKDSRVRYFHNAKGEGNGELHRAEALKEARGKVICYLGDDDLWLPHHLEVMIDLLADRDFCHTAHAKIKPTGELDCSFISLENASVREFMLANKWNFFGPTCAGHTSEAYRRLPYGWRPKPEGMWSDLHMWRQWLTFPGLTVTSSAMPTTLTFPSPWRGHMSSQQRLKELEVWFERSRQSEFRSQLEQAAHNQQRRFVQSWQKGISDALIMMEKSELERATRLADMVEFNIGPQSEVHYIKSVVAKAKGDSTLARKYALEATELWPEISSVHYRLAVLLAELGDLKLAKSSINRAVALDPSVASYRKFSDSLV